MPVLFVTDPRFHDHETGRSHVEIPARLNSVVAGVRAAHLEDDLIPAVPRAATALELTRVHDADLVRRVESACESSTPLDPDTVTVPASWPAALLAAGAGLVAIEALDAGEAESAFCAVRPPGHHATRTTSMGFCLFNNVAVTAAALVDRGERVLIADIDAHHGNGTQDIFYDDRRVLFVSWHQWPLYPGTGRVDETGSGEAAGSTLNIPLPPGSTGDHYRRALDEVVMAAVEAFAPTWLLISAGFDAHRADPLASMGLTAGDYSDLVTRLAGLVGRGRVIVFLEGGYDLGAIERSSTATVSALAGTTLHEEAPTVGGPGATAVDNLAEFHRRRGVLAT